MGAVDAEQDVRISESGQLAVYLRHPDRDVVAREKSRSLAVRRHAVLETATQLLKPWLVAHSEPVDVVIDCTEIGYARLSGERIGASLRKPQTAA